MKRRILIFSFIFLLIALAVFSQMKNENYVSAKDFPREALIYVQVADLPKFIKLWNKSKLKENYLKSENFSDFSNNHLGRKLASRWNEFNDAAGFSFDLETISNFTENRAAFAIYDVGKLEFVFIAPVSDEVFAATKFLQNKGNFTEEILPDETTIYRVSVEADRGRQNQSLIFTHKNGRLIVATSEKLIVQTLENIGGKTSKKSLADEPSFQVLSSKIVPNAATIWLNQTALNQDYYFKKYWLMSDLEKLKNIRAGIFDFEISEDRFIEKRQFLLEKSVDSAPVNLRQAENLYAFLPENIPFYDLRKAENETLDEAVEKTLFYRSEPIKIKKNRREYFDYDYAFYNSRENFDKKIDETDETETVERREKKSDFAKIMQSGNTQSVLSFAEPKILSAPLFIKFDRAAIFYLSSPKSFDNPEFESELTRVLLSKTMIFAPNVNLKWKTKNENGIGIRELKIPMIGWEICYVLYGNALILTNNAGFMQKIISSKKDEVKFESKNDFEQFTVIDLTQKETAFSQVFNKIGLGSEVDSFFYGNVESLLESINKVERIEVRRRNSQNFMDEEITFKLKSDE
ncbi:MAG TPA: hypothetical protein PKY59_07835 [Pyrinomonadaceae bacterium]|nr:hypothetical protein [Pyrinomonadaceae bacterium]